MLIGALISPIAISGTDRGMVGDAGWSGTGRGLHGKEREWRGKERDWQGNEPRSTGRGLSLPPRDNIINGTARLIVFLYLLMIQSNCNIKMHSLTFPDDIAPNTVYHGTPHLPPPPVLTSV